MSKTTNHRPSASALIYQKYCHDKKSNFLNAVIHYIEARYTHNEASISFEALFKAMKSYGFEIEESQKYYKEYIEEGVFDNDIFAGVKLKGISKIDFISIATHLTPDKLTQENQESEQDLTQNLKNIINFPEVVPEVKEETPEEKILNKWLIKMTSTKPTVDQKKDEFVSLISQLGKLNPDFNFSDFFKANRNKIYAKYIHTKDPDLVSKLKKQIISIYNLALEEVSNAIYKEKWEGENY